MNDLVELQGTIEKVVFRSEESGYSITIVKVTSKETVTVCGSFPSLQAGEHVIFKGNWVTHPKFGRQFEAQGCVSQLPTSVNGIQKYLSSGLIKGIGPAFAQRLVDRFGSATLEIIDSDPDKLATVEGIGPKRVEVIITAWRDQKEISRVMVFLQDKGISPEFATKIFKAYGQASIEKIMANPYRLAEDIWGVGFKSADKVALKLGFAPHCLERIKAGVLYAILQATEQGHLYAELEVLRAKTLELLELTDQDCGALIKQGLHELYTQEKIKLVTHKEGHYLALPQYYFSEKGIARRLRSLNKKTSFTDRFDFDEIYKLVSQSDERGVLLNEDQQRGILLCLQNKIAIITGGPGTGKTTLIKKLLAVLEKYRCKYRLAAPTGRAAKRMFEGTGKSAETLHRVLEFNPQAMGFTKNEQNAIDCDFLIVDEASMIDVFLMHSLLRALPDRAHLILIGDVDQLPSVGAGNVLHDMISSEIIALVALKHIFRQADNSLIVVNAHRVNKGEFPVSSMPDSRNDFVFIKENTAENFLALLPSLYEKAKKRGIDASHLMVLCPMNRGLVGTQRINQELQQMLNPAHEEKAQIMRFSTLYRVGDRVMQIKNNYDKFVFNGDLGEIGAVDTVEQTVVVRFGERLLEYNFYELNELTLSYAISIHKSQGSEFRGVILPLFMQHFMMLQRNLIYTAITRAKDYCIMVGESRAIAMGIKNKKEIKRLTFLKEFLTTTLEAR